MFLERNDFFMTILIFIIFVSYSICKWHTLLIYYVYGIEESNSSQEKNPLLYYLVLKEKQLCLENYFYRMFNITKGNDHVMKPFNNYFYCHFIRKFIYLTTFHSISIFNGFIPLVSVY